MHNRATARTGWEEWDDNGDDDFDRDDDFDLDRVAMVEDGFERGAALHGLWVRVRSQEFRSGRVTAVFAGVTVDLREATLSPEGATIHVQAALSGIEILVPPGWDVICDVDAICSGVGGQRRVLRTAEPRPRLRIAGMVVAGGLSVR